jgi:Leucine-rich repeat (LRR) protein
MNKLILIVGIILILFAVVFTRKDSEPLLSESDSEATATEGSNLSNNATINLSNEGLESIPEYVFSKTNTEKLDVSNNNLTGSIQSQIGQLKDLKVLDASNNSMTGVPAEIGHLEKLEILDLSNNELTGLPNELGNLKNLKVLNLSGNDYSQQDIDGIILNLPEGTEVIIN